MNNKSVFNTRWAQMTKQEQIIERKKMEIQAKLEAQKQAAALAAQAKIENQNKPKAENNINIFSNDGSFMNQFKSLLEKQKKEKQKHVDEEKAEEAVEKVKGDPASDNHTQANSEKELGEATPRDNNKNRRDKNYDDRRHGSRDSKHNRKNDRYSQDRSSSRDNRSHWRAKHNRGGQSPLQNHEDRQHSDQMPPFRQFQGMPYNDQSFEDLPFNEQPFNNQPFNDRPYNERMFNDRGFNDESFNDRPFNDESFNDRSFNNQPFSDRPFNDQSFNERQFRDQSFNNEFNNQPFKEQSFNEQSYNNEQDRDEKSFDKPPASRGPLLPPSFINDFNETSKQSHDSPSISGVSGSGFSNMEPGKGSRGQGANSMSHFSGQDAEIVPTGPGNSSKDAGPLSMGLVSFGGPGNGPILPGNNQMGPPGNNSMGPPGNMPMGPPGNLIMPPGMGCPRPMGPGPMLGAGPMGPGPMGPGSGPMGPGSGPMGPGSNPMGPGSSPMGPMPRQMGLGPQPMGPGPAPLGPGPNIPPFSMPPFLGGPFPPNMPPNFMGPNGPVPPFFPPFAPNPPLLGSGPPPPPPNNDANSKQITGSDQNMGGINNMRPPFEPNVSQSFGNNVPPFRNQSMQDKNISEPPNNIPLPTSHIRHPDEMGNAMPPHLRQEVLSADAMPPGVRRLAEEVALRGDQWESNVKAQQPNLWFLHNTNSKEYKSYRMLVVQLREEDRRKKPEIKPEDKYEPEFSLQDEDSNDEYDYNTNTQQESPFGKGFGFGNKDIDDRFTSTKKPSQMEDDENKKREKRKRKSRWGDDPPVDIKPPGVVIPPFAVPPMPDSMSVPMPPGIPGSFMQGPPMPGMNIAAQPMQAALMPAGAKLAKIDQSGLKLTTVNRNNPALLQYAMTNYGTTQLSHEDWKKCEDNFKLNLLYQDMMQKKQAVEKLAAAGKNKYEYDSDEDTADGTWEHKLRAKEMNATEKWADELTKQAAGKHHIGDFLPPEELKKFMSKYSKGGREPDLSDYKEFKLGQDNVGFKMLQKLGWNEGQGLGAEGGGIVNPVNATQTPANVGLGAGVSEADENDDEFDAYRKRMMLAYRFRPNPLNNPRRPYY